MRNNALQIPQLEKWTYDDMITFLPEESRFEIVDNVLFEMTSPSTIHQRVSVKLLSLFLNYISQHASGEIFHAPLDLVLNQGNVVQPDLIYISNEKKSIIERKGIFGPPDIVVEIISPSTHVRDIAVKKDLYEKFGVTEFWLIDPLNEAFEIFTLQNNKYKVFAFANTSGIVESHQLNGLVINLEELFKN